MRRLAASLYLSNILLFAFATAWLGLIFIPLLIATDHIMGLWYENNLAILALEAGICIFGITWSISRIIYYIKRQVRTLKARKTAYVKT